MTLTESIAGTFAVIGQNLTDVQLAMLTKDLEAYPLSDVLTALGRCRKELRKIALVDILERLPHGHPGPEEAWAIVSQAFTQPEGTLVWTDEMRMAYGTALPLGEDLVAARMAFKEHYAAQMVVARDQRIKPNWSVSLGSDKAGRELVITEAVKRGRLSLAYAQKLLPMPEDPQTIALLESLCPRLLS